MTRPYAPPRSSSAVMVRDWAATRVAHALKVLPLPTATAVRTIDRPDTPWLPVSGSCEAIVRVREPGSVNVPSLPPKSPAWHVCFWSPSPSPSPPPPLLLLMQAGDGWFARPKRSPASAQLQEMGASCTAQSKLSAAVLPSARPRLTDMTASESGSSRSCLIVMVPQRGAVKRAVATAKGPEKPISEQVSTAPVAEVITSVRPWIVSAPNRVMPVSSFTNTCGACGSNKPRRPLKSPACTPPPPPPPAPAVSKTSPALAHAVAGSRFGLLAPTTPCS